MGTSVVRPTAWWDRRHAAARVLRHFAAPPIWVDSDQDDILKVLGDMQRLGYVALRPEAGEHAGSGKGVWVELTDSGREILRDRR